MQDLHNLMHECRPGCPMLQPLEWRHGTRTPQVGADVWLLTYRLHQPGRVTRRMTLWRREESSWQAVYHQGTVVGG